MPEGEASEALPESLTRYTGFLLAKAHQRLFAMFTEECRRQNIDAPNPGVLHLLEEMGPMSQQQLGRKLRIDRTTMVKIVDSLEEKHLARRRNHPEDRRAYLVEISAQGKKALAAAARVAEKLESELLARFSPEERKLIRRALLTLAG